MINTSTRIRQYLELNDTATVEQLSNALDLTKADIHYHVRLLLKQGVIDTHPELHQEGAGRPARKFILIKPAPESLSRLIISLLTEFHTKNDGDQTYAKGLIAHLASGILKHSCASVNQYHSATLRLTQIIRNLSGLGIYLRWLARKDGPHIYVEQEYLSTLIREPHLADKIIEALLREIKAMIA